MQTLNIGKKLQLPLEVATQATTITGLRGSGKSHTAAVIIEELLTNQIPVLVIDPTDVWYGLLSSKDGKRDGYSVAVFGGDHGHMPVTQFDGKSVAEFCVKERVPIVLSIRHLRKGEQRRLVAELFTELYHLKGRPENRTPLTVVIDEAPLFVPQLAHRGGGDEAAVVGAVEDLVNRGRSAGFGVIMISQRSATINKNVFDMAEMMIVHRSTSPRDRRAFMEWIEENADIEQTKEVLSSLSSLKDGEAWIWAPKLGIFDRTQIRERHTYDSSRTPKIGEIIAPPKKFADVDREALAAKFAANLEVAKRNDPVELKKQVKELEAQLAKAQQATPSPEALKAERAKVATEFASLLVAKKIALIDYITTQFDDPTLPTTQATLVSKPPAKQPTETISTKPAAVQVGKWEAASPPQKQAAAPVPNKSVVNVFTSDDIKITMSHGRIYAAVNWWLDNVKEENPTFLEVATVARMSEGGHFDNLRRDLVKWGLLQVGDSPSTLRLTTTPMTYVPIQLQPTADAMLTHICGIVKNGTKVRMLNTFRSIREPIIGGMTPEELATAAGMKQGGHFDNLRRELTSSGYLEKVGSMLRLGNLVRRFCFD